MRYLFLTYLILNPLFYMFDMEFRQAQEYCFQMSSMILVACSMFFERKRVNADKMHMALGALLAWFIFEYILQLNGWSVLMNLFLGLAVYFTAIATLDKKDAEFLVKGFFWVMLLSCVFQIGQFFRFDLRGQHMTFNGTHEIIAGSVPDSSFFGLKAAMGMYYAITTALLLPFLWPLRDDSKWSLWFGVPYLGLLFVPLASSFSSGAYLAGVVALFLVLWFRKRILFWISLVPVILGMVGFVVFMDAPMGMMTSRLPMWGMVFQDTSQSPLVGFGLDGFRQPQAGLERQKVIRRYFKNAFDDKTHRVTRRVIAGDVKVEEWMLQGNLSKDELDRMEQRNNAGMNPFDFWDHPHNEFLWLAYETGFIGLGIFIGVLYFIIKRFRRCRKGALEVGAFAAIVSVLVSSTTQFPFHLARIAHCVPVLLAMFYLATEDNDFPEIVGVGNRE